MLAYLMTLAFMVRVKHNRKPSAEILPGDSEELEHRLAQSDPANYWSTHHLQLSVVAFRAIAQTAINVSSKPLHNVYEGHSSGRQLGETVDVFLMRLPPLTTSIHHAGPWIYIANPHSEYRSTKEHLKALEEGGKRLLDEFDATRVGIEAGMADKAKSTVTRKITPLRKQLEKNLLHLATETGCTSGKWMMFPGPDEVNRFWSHVANGTVAEELGYAAKVATDEGSNGRSGRLICVYTDDFRDMQSVKRVLERLVDMGLVYRKGPMGEMRGIYYKADMYTHLGINRDNEWGLKPSMYSSQDILTGRVK